MDGRCERFCIASVLIASLFANGCSVVLEGASSSEEHTESVVSGQSFDSGENNNSNEDIDDDQNSGDSDIPVVGPPGPILTPGTGFTGVTSEPPPFGSGPTVSAKVIGAWNVVPHHAFDGEFNIGVPAFHTNGMDYVSFSFQGGPWTPVTQMSYNPQSETVEYWATIRAQDVSDGEVEVRAIAYPKTAGVPRLLRLKLFANGNHTLFSGVKYADATLGNDNNDGSSSAPTRTIRRALELLAAEGDGDTAGGTVRLRGGSVNSPKIYDYFADKGWTAPTKKPTWVTIEADAGVNVDEVEIIKSFDFTPVDRIVSGYLRFSDVTVRDLLAGNDSGHIWFDRVHLKGDSPFKDVGNGSGWLFGFKNKWLTSSKVSNNALGATEGFKLIRGVRVENIDGDAFRCGDRTIINSSIENVGFPDTDSHPDGFEWGGCGGVDSENYLAYGVTFTNVRMQVIYVVPCACGPITQRRDNIAFINVVIDVIPSSFKSGFHTLTNHLLLWHVTFANQHLLFTNNGLSNIDVRASSFTVMAWNKGHPDISPPTSNSELESLGKFDNNHYQDPDAFHGLSPGSKATFGNPLFVNAAANDYHPSSNSSLVNRPNLETLVPVDIDNKARPVCTIDPVCPSAGALEP